MGSVDIIILAALAGFVIWRLMAAFGTREGHEHPTGDPFTTRREGRTGARSGKDNVVQMPGTQAQPSNFAHVAPEGSPLSQGLMEIQLADRSFSPDTFLSGARQAYEMIVTAFANADRRSLRPLLDDETYDDFDAALRAREQEGQRVEMTFVGLESSRIIEATLRGSIAEVTVKFISEIISLTKNADGIVIEGDPQTVRKVTDVWTFARDTHSTDPNWLLVATDEG